MKKVPTYAKAIAAAATSFLGALGTAIADGKVSPDEWIGIAITTVVATAAVYGVRNGISADPTTSTPEV